MNRSAKSSLKITLLLVSTLTVMSGALIAPALPMMAKAFSGLANADFLTKLVLTMPALWIAITSPLAGALVDRYGRLRLLVLAMTVYAVAGGAGLVLGNIYLLLASRALLGIAVAFIMTIIATLVGDYLYGEERSRFLGIQGGFMAFGGTVFVALSGWLSDGSWRYPFSLYLLSLPFIVLVLQFLHEPPKESEEETSADGAAVSHLGLYAGVYLTVFLGMVLFYLAPAQLPFLMEAIGVQSAFQGSLGLVLITLTASAASLNYSRIKGKTTFHQVYVIVFLLIAVGFGSVYWLHTFAPILVAMAVAGVGAGLLLPNTSLCLLSTASPRTRGRVLGGMTSAIFLGQFFSPILAEPLLKHFSIFSVYLIGAVLALVVALSYLFLALRYRVSQSREGVLA